MLRLNQSALEFNRDCWTGRLGCIGKVRTRTLWGSTLHKNILRIHFERSRAIYRDRKRDSPTQDGKLFLDWFTGLRPLVPVPSSRDWVVGLLFGKYSCVPVQVLANAYAHFGLTDVREHTNLSNLAKAVRAVWLDVPDWSYHAAGHTGMSGPSARKPMGAISIQSAQRC